MFLSVQWQCCIIYIVAMKKTAPLGGVRGIAVYVCRSCTLIFLPYIKALWHENSFIIAGLLWGKSTVHQWKNPLFIRGYPLQRANNTDVLFDVNFVVSPVKLLNKQSGWQWFQKPWHSCDIILMAIENMISMELVNWNWLFKIPEKGFFLPWLCNFIICVMAGHAFVVVKEVSCHNNSIA